MMSTGINKVLLAVDGSPHSRAAVSALASLGAARNAEVTVLHVWSLEVKAVGTAWDVETAGEARRFVAGIADELEAAGMTATAAVRAGDRKHVAAEIEAAALEFGADLVVVGSRGLSDFGALTHGSVSYEVVRRLGCPVLVVRRTDSAPRSMERVLLAIANGEEASPAVATTAELASATGAEVLVLHCAQLITSSEAIAYVEPEEVARATVDAAVAELRRQGVKAKGTLTTATTRPADEIAAVARAWNADLIIVGSNRAGQIAALLFGSVSHGVIHVSERPVLVARREEPAEPARR